MATPASPLLRESPESWDLVRAVQQGDVDTFSILFERYSTLVLRYFLSRNLDAATAEDLTSETFVRAFRSIQKVADRGKDVGSWLMTIARNLGIDHLKSGQVRHETPTAELSSQGKLLAPGPEAQVLASIELIDVRRRLAQLNGAQRECLVLRRIHGYSVSETAAAMNKSEQAVRALQHRAARQFDDLVDDAWRGSTLSPHGIP